VTTQTQSNDQTQTTTQTKDPGEMSFAEYEALRRGESVAVEGKNSAPAETSVEQKKSEDSETLETEAKDDESEADDSEESEAKDSEADKGKKKTGIQRRVDKLTKAKREAQQEAEYWKRRALEGATDSKHDAQTVDKPEAKAAEGKPDPEKFETHAEYVEALTDWKLEQREKAAKAEAAKTQFETDQQKAKQAHAERVKAFAEKTEDFAEMMENLDDVPASPALEQLIVSSANSAELLYELAKNPDEAKRIAALPPLSLARELGKIEARLSKQASEAQKPEPKKLTNAPKPIDPVSAGKGVVRKSISDPDLPFAEYERLRREQLRKRRA
jgi:hypothetical protein